MFSKRSDGRVVKMDPLLKQTPHIMSRRSDAMNYCKVPVRCEAMDEFIKKMRAEEGVHFTYIDIFIACMVRLMAERKHLNRFVNNGRVYQRDYIDICFVVKKSMRGDDDVETTVKIRFTGTETLYEVNKKVWDTIRANSNTTELNDIDKTAAFIGKFPNFMLRIIWWTLKKLEKYNMLPASLVYTSCFHNSCFITNMKSIKGDYIYHHCYDFGTTGIFIAMGKEKLEPVVEKGELAVGKIMNLGVVLDERFCDGLYFARSVRMLKSYFDDLSVLLTPYHDKEVDALTERYKKEQEKEALKAAKKAKKKKNKAELQTDGKTE